jgi:patatin-related protein
LNGVCLATALANDFPGADTQLDSLEDLWVKHGDLETLFAGQASARDDAGQIDERLLMPAAPPSLLNGLRFYKLLEETLRDKLAHEASDEGSRLVDQLDLWVTATDLDGRPVTIPIQNATVSERDHAYRFHFLYDPARRQNDFTKDVAPLIAFAGRSTSSFPVAFEPMRLERILPFADISGDWPPRFYSDYDAQRFKRVQFSDGGILDNKPFSYATQELARRPSTLPVTRYLVYVEPDPKPSGPEGPPGEWNARDTAIAALTGIPRSETIRGDLELVRSRNQAIRRARRLLALSALNQTEQERLAAMVPRLDRDDWLAMGFEAMVDAQPQFGPTYPVYHRLKVSVVCDYLASLLARTLGVSDEGEDMPKLRAIVEAWKRDRYREEPGVRAPSDEFPLTETQFLFRFDIPFRMRRLSFLLTRLVELDSDDEARVESFFAAAGASTVPEFNHDDVQALRSALTKALIRLLDVERRLPRDRPFAASLAESGIHPGTLSGMNAEDDEWVAAQVPDGITERGDPFDRIVMDAAKDATEQARIVVEEALGERLSQAEVEQISSGGTIELARVVRFHYDAFEGFDLIYLPLSYETAIADTHPVRVIRVSPLDATKPAGVSRTLQGAALNHFAAFTDATWRRHDIAWGRLNAAEILIRNLLPDDGPAADSLIDEAHEIIRAHYVGGAQPVPERQTTERAADGQELFAGVPVTKDPPRAALIKRGATIASATAEKQLEDEGKTTPAKAVRLTTQAAEGAGAWRLLRGLYGLLPTFGQILICVVPLLILSVVVILALLGLLAGGGGAVALFVAAALVFGLLVGAGALIIGVVEYGRRRMRKTIDRVLDRN